MASNQQHQGGAISSYQSNQTTLELDLLENGIDFILRGIDDLFDEDHAWQGSSSPPDVSTTRYKYGYLHLFSGFLLLLKERLLRHLPELIYKGRLTDVRQRIAGGKLPNTIDLDEALERLEMGPKVIFTPNEVEVIKRAQEFRNQFEHFKVNANKYHLWENATSFLVIIDKFLVGELHVNIQASADSIMLLRKIETIEAFWDRVHATKYQEWEYNIERKRNEFTLNRNSVVRELDNEWHNASGEIPPFIDCPACGEETLIASGEFQGICSNVACESVHPITNCAKCGQVIVGYPWSIEFCQYCKQVIEEE